MIDDPCFEQILSVEKKAIAERRIGDRFPSVACSGGGMRAAAFSLGGLEALSETLDPNGTNSLFDRLGYLSSVSGGSWATCSLASKVLLEDKAQAIPNRAYIGQIAQRAKLLNSRGIKDYLEIMGLWCYSFLTGLLLLLPILLLLSTLFIFFFPKSDDLKLYDPRLWVVRLGAAVAAYYAAFALTYSTAFTRRIAIFLGRWWSAFLGAVVGILFVVLQPKVLFLNLPGQWIYDYLRETLVSILGFQEIILVGLTLFFSIMLLIILLARQEQFSRKAPHALSTTARKMFITILLLLNSILVPVFLWMLVLMLARWGIGDIPSPKASDPDFNLINDHHFAPQWVTSAAVFVNKSLGNYEQDLGPSYSAFIVLYLGIAGVLFFVGKFLIDTNWTSFHRFYRDRLRASFIFPLESDRPPLISQLANVNFPYLLVNCTANVKSNASSSQLEDPFVVSPQYAGNNALGFCSMSIFDRHAGEAFDLATIAAISGAAISPMMGRFTSKSFRMLMSLLAFRLGYWAPNPGRLGGRDSKLPVGRRVGSFYFFREMLGLMYVNANYVYLTDGGHTDNSAIFELLRRECLTILALDAEADPERLFDNLAYVIQLARVKLGVEILLSGKDVAKTGGVHCAIGRIIYPIEANQSQKFGTLVYCKSSITGTENLDLVSRKRATGEFPYNSTLNQNYDELLFDAYRTLGFLIVNGVLTGQQEAEFWDGSIRPLTNSELTELFAQ